MTTPPKLLFANSWKRLPSNIERHIWRVQLIIFSIRLLLIQREDGFSLANVTYDQVAHHVGLQPWNELTDIQTFELHCSRIPTDVFRSIVIDMDIMLMQYGPLSQHKTEEARSRFFSPVRCCVSLKISKVHHDDPQVFNHLVKQFTFMLRNYPETIECRSVPGVASSTSSKHLALLGFSASR